MDGLGESDNEGDGWMAAADDSTGDGTATPVLLKVGDGEADGEKVAGVVAAVAAATGLLDGGVALGVAANAREG